MPGSTYSSNLKIELMTTGENSGTWGDVTNTNLGTALEQAIIGYGNPDYTSDANLTITITNSNASQAARCLVLNVTSVFGSLTATRELIVPTSQKQYIVQNNTTGGQSITVKTSAGTGITVPNGRKAHLYVNGTDVIQMFDFVDINGGAIDGTPIGASSASTGAFTTLGATGNVTLGDADTDTITQAASYVTGTQLKSAKTATNTLSLAAYDVDGTAYTNLITLTASNTPTLALTSTGVGSMDNIAIGATTASTGAFTTLSANSTVTLSGGTANGVAYLNGSKVLTTGSALTFDGTNLSTGSGSFFANGTSGITGFRAQTTSNYAEIQSRPDISYSRILSSAYLLDLATLSNQPILFTINSTEQMRLTSTGLGIGTSSPAKRLDVRQAYTTDTVVAQIGNTNNGNGSTPVATIFDFTEANGTAVSRISSIYTQSTGKTDLAFGTYNSGLSEKMRLDSSGNLGIGTTSPSTGKFSDASCAVLVQSSSTSTGTNIFSSNSNNTKFVGFWSGHSGADSAVGVKSGTALTFGAWGAINGAGGFSEWGRFDSSGNLGIGTTSPAYKLDVTGAINATNTSNTTVATGGFDASTSWSLKVANASTTAGTGAGIFFLGGTNSESWIGNLYESSGVGALSFQTRVSGTRAERMRIDNSGNLLVGTTGLGTIGSSSGFQITSSGAIYSASTGDSVFSRRSTNGTVITFRRDTTSVGSIDVTTTATSYVTSSDYRLKNTIAPMTGALAKVALLKPCTYKWNADGSDGQGFIAHELAEVVPQCVTGEKDAVDADGKPQYQGIDTSFLVATLTAAIQEQQALITQLTARITALEGA